MKKHTILILILVVLTSVIRAQEFEWVETNTYSNIGERIVAILDAGSIGTYTGIQILGQVIDSNGNWGYNLPTVANFGLYINFSGGPKYNLIQDNKTNSIILGLRHISDTEVHLVANCPIAHRTVRVNFSKIQGGASISMGDPRSVVIEGSSLLSEPEYRVTLGIGSDVSINTSTSCKLDVNGTIRAKEIKVEDIAANNTTLTGTLSADQITINTNGNTADFVFEPDYNLLDLSEVENFITTNKHLPDVPSAATMEEEGVNLAEMNKLLLQKVEELTLYVIEMKKEIEKQNTELNKLKDK